MPFDKNLINSKQTSVKGNVTFQMKITLDKKKNPMLQIFLLPPNFETIETLRDKPVLFTNLYPIQTCYIH